MVSIIIPTFNSSNTLRDALESVKNQTFQSWECIVIDAVSKDNTLDIVQQYAIDDTRFRFVFEKDSIFRISTLPLSLISDDSNNICFASIYKKKKIIALPPLLYDSLYLKHNFCNMSNLSTFSDQWYQYKSIFIKKYKGSNQIRHLSCGKVLKFPLNFAPIQKKLDQSIKYSIEKPLIITTKKGNSYILVDIGGQIDMKEVKQMIEIY